MTVKLCQKGLCTEPADHFSTYYSEGRPVAIHPSCTEHRSAPYYSLQHAVLSKEISWKEIVETLCLHCGNMLNNGDCACGEFLMTTYLPAWLLNRAHANRQVKIDELKAQISRLQDAQGHELIRELEGVEFKPGQFCWENLTEWLGCKGVIDAKAIRIGVQWSNPKGDLCLLPSVQIHESDAVFRILPNHVDLHGYENHVDGKAEYKRLNQQPEQ